MRTRRGKNKSVNKKRLFRFLYLFAGIFFFLPSFSQNVNTLTKEDSLAIYFSMIPVEEEIPDVPIPMVSPELVMSPLITNNTFSASIGSANMYDTYLSPLEYKGFNIRLMYEQLRRTTWFDYKFYKQQIFELDFSKGDNPAGNVSEYWLLANYRLGGHYSLYNTPAFRLGVGGFWDVNAGVLYNERNGNNPATARAYTNLNLSVIASYKFKWFALRWQVGSPFMGMLFSPKYGQSYYEISLGNSVGVVNFASLHNQRALRNYLTVDIPINKYTIRVGYLGSWYQTKVHDIQTHHYTNSFVIGFPMEGVKKPREKARNNYWNGY
ncbi:hypothetical protein M2451_002113 [Dysgonomonas sp. PFB1-18]|uniref:DUF3316 domain-containing protein n=1 Tax=unclassified Dysgonomonas TaxID=2630389 RepID=UPI002476C32A|nr:MULTISPECIES: DUF3316 domain-containing protein [unclassified Dysgonomonas]MDH6309703.1 hypothetical protein [Dysgonomonas sp. PF1-14]MDH6339289.1 hypothetical protein [Dysgonomonas sp. PF1-16]MDH6380788.1 hypothetical protein [Dysgonomonas sp. PFB1-18]MDH6398284.1 hypothetical protein [Dysgonomonas sp. PF1-23]